MPAFAIHHTTEIQGIKTHFVRLGSGKKKLICLHGWGGSTQSFFDTAAQLAEKRPSLEIILLDMPGFGRTGNPDVSGWDTYKYAEWVQAFCDQQEIKKASFFVHSFGGRILTRLMIKNPKLGEKLVYMGAAGIKWPLGSRAKLAQALSINLSRVKKFLPGRLRRLVLTKIFGAEDWGDAKPGLRESLRKVTAEDDIRDDLIKIEQKSLLLWGAKDKHTPLRSGKIYAEKLPANQLVVFPDGGHSPQYTHQTEVVEHLVKFL